MSKLENLVFYNDDKLARATKAVKEKGGSNPAIAENTLYHRAVNEVKDLSEDDLVVYIYKGLGGKVDELPSVKAAEEIKTELKEVRKGKKKKAK